MTNDELQKLAAALTDCGKALLKISEAMAVKEDAVRIFLRPMVGLPAVRPGMCQFAGYLQ